MRIDVEGIRKKMGEMHSEIKGRMDGIEAITKVKTKGQHHQQPSTAAGVILLRLWGSLQEKRGEGDLAVETPPLQIYRAFSDEPTRTNLDRSSRQNGAHAPVAAPLPPTASPLHSDQNPLPTHSTSL
nr:hypothetical protein Iba_chr07aCG5680 [Ipomoea batatas]